MDATSRGRATDDRLAAPSRRVRTPASRIGVAIDNLLEAMYGAGDDAEASYAGVLEELRAHADEAVIVLAQQEASCDARTYPRRWALIHAATQLQHDAALPFLRQVVLNPIPPERSDRPHSYSTVKEETVLRTTAVEGVGALARTVTRTRRRRCSSSSRSIRSPSAASVQSLLAVDEGLRERAPPTRLRRDLHYLLDIRPARVTDVPQVEDPTRHLREDRLPEKPAPPDPEGSAPPADEHSGPRTGA